MAEDADLQICNLGLQLNEHLLAELGNAPCEGGTGTGSIDRDCQLNPDRNLGAFWADEAGDAPS